RPFTKLFLHASFLSKPDNPISSMMFSVYRNTASHTEKMPRATDFNGNFCIAGLRCYNQITERHFNLVNLAHMHGCRPNNKKCI
ncbi:TPA: hypothetical protein ACFU2Q_002273, partial [Neisseria subflava]